MKSKGAIFNRMLAIGVGLIGGSVCLAAKKKGLVDHVLGYSRKLETAHQALNLGIVDECIAAPCDSNLLNIDAVVLSVPVGQYKQVLRQFLPVLPPSCLIFDVGSTKTGVALELDELEQQFPGLKSRFILAHPIAGAESHGPAAAFANLFEGRNCVICPLPQTSTTGLKKVQDFWVGLGAKTSTMDAKDHDEMFGAVSHLPHLLSFGYVSSVLAHSKGSEFMKEGGAGFRDFTRIAASSPEMWADIFQSNSTALLSMLDEFERHIAALRLAIEGNDRNTLEYMLGQAAQYRKHWKQN